MVKTTLDGAGTDSGYQANGALSRRDALLGTAGAAAASLAGAGSLMTLATQSAFAAAPPVGKQVPSAYRYRIGDVEVTAICDGTRAMPLSDGFVRNAPKEQVAAALREAFLPDDNVPLVFNVLLLNIGGRLVLVDTGNGPSAGGAPSTVGLVPSTLVALGVDPAKVNQVVISHFHPDHINGLLTASGAPAYPNAEVLVPEPEWAFWTDDGELSRAPERLRGTFANVKRVFGPFAGKVTRYAWGKEVAPGLTAVAAAGHTPGHTAFELQSGTGTLFIQSDTSNLPALFVRNPRWQAIFDMDPEKATQNRLKVYDRLSADRTAVAGYHFPFPGAGHLEKAGEGFRLVPVFWNPVL